MNTKNLTRTAILIALLVALQAATKPLGNQFITGSCVNLVLAVAALFCGPASASIVAIVSPFFAYLLGIAPQIWLAPAIALVLVKLIIGGGTLFGTVIIMEAAMPCAMLSVILSERYHADVEFATKGVMLTTILCLITIPIVAITLQSI